MLSENSRPDRASKSDKSQKTTSRVASMAQHNDSYGIRVAFSTTRVHIIKSNASWILGSALN